MREFCVLLDNGHGKETAGKRSPKWDDGTQLFEWEENRKIVAAIEKKLKAIGIKCIRLVPEDKDITLSSRAARANQYVDKYRCIMISVHCNAARQPNTAWGWSVWTTTAKNNSDKLAQCFLNHFKECIPGRKNRGHYEKNFTVIFKTNCPCVLTENFFMDTYDECQYLLSEKGIDEIAELHVRAILEFQEKYYPETVKGAVVTSTGCAMK